MKERQPMIHHLKIAPKYFNAVVNHQKYFELRCDDRDFRVGDCVILQEYENGEYTLNEHIVKITYILRDCEEYGLMRGFCIFCWNF